MILYINIYSINKKIYIFGIAMDSEEKKEVISEANKKNIPTLCDPKNTNFYSFKNCTLIKPNLSEIMSGGNIKINLKNENTSN